MAVQPEAFSQTIAPQAAAPVVPVVPVVLMRSPVIVQDTGHLLFNFIYSCVLIKQERHWLLPFHRGPILVIGPQPVKTVSELFSSVII